METKIRLAGFRLLHKFIRSESASSTTWLPVTCSFIVFLACMFFQSRAQDVWLEGHHSEERAAIFLQPLVLQTQTTLPLSHSRASSLMRGASGITVVMRLRTLMTHVTAYGVEWKRRYGLQGCVLPKSSHGLSCFFDNTLPNVCPSIS